jgi:protein phosphatase
VKGARVVVIDLPSDALVLLVGPAGCGKSTFARTHFAPTQVVSSDECRALVSNDESNSAASADAFALMHFITEKRLKRHRLTVADATNVHAEKREALLAIARHWRRPAFAIVFDLPAALCQERNRLRAGRQVPPAGVAAHVAALRESLPQMALEGYAAMWVLGSAEEVEHAVVRVHPAP